MNRVVVFERFGDPEVPQLRRRAEPHPGPGEIRARVRAIGLNPMDWMIAASPGLAAAFGASFPAGFAHDSAGVVDEVGTGVGGVACIAVGDRVFGSVSSRAAADHVIVRSTDAVWHTPEEVSDTVREHADGGRPDRLGGAVDDPRHGGGFSRARVGGVAHARGHPPSTFLPLPRLSTVPPPVSEARSILGAWTNQLRQKLSATRGPSPQS